jgi:hypothetical protein
MDFLITWDFSHGSKVARQVRRRFESSVHLQEGIPSHGFFLVAEFLDCSFDLNEENVSLALESCIGGYADRLNVVWLRDQIFKFRVASNRVGHFIHALDFFKCSDFTCYFHLLHDKSTRHSVIADLSKNDGNWIVPGKFKQKQTPAYLLNFPVHLKGKANGVVSRSVAIKPDLSIFQKNAEFDLHHAYLQLEQQHTLNNTKFGDFRSRRDQAEILIIYPYL